MVGAQTLRTFPIPRRAICACSHNRHLIIGKCSELSRLSGVYLAMEIYLKLAEHPPGIGGERQQCLVVATILRPYGTVQAPSCCHPVLVPDASLANR